MYWECPRTDVYCLCVCRSAAGPRPAVRRSADQALVHRHLMSAHLHRLHRRLGVRRSHGWVMQRYIKCTSGQHERYPYTSNHANHVDLQFSERRKNSGMHLNNNKKKMKLTYYYVSIDYNVTMVYFSAFRNKKITLIANSLLLCFWWFQLSPMISSSSVSPV